MPAGTSVGGGRRAPVGPLLASLLDRTACFACCVSGARAPTSLPPLSARSLTNCCGSFLQCNPAPVSDRCMSPDADDDSDPRMQHTEPTVSFHSAATPVPAWFLGANQRCVPREYVSLLEPQRSQPCRISSCPRRVLRSLDIVRMLDCLRCRAIRHPDRSPAITNPTERAMLRGILTLHGSRRVGHVARTCLRLGLPRAGHFLCQ